MPGKGTHGTFMSPRNIWRLAKFLSWSLLWVDLVIITSWHMWSRTAIWFGLQWKSSCQFAHDNREYLAANIHCWQVYQYQFENRLIDMNFEGSKLSYAQFSMTIMVEIIATSCIWLWTSTNSDFNESLKFISICQQLLWSTHQYANMKISYINVYPFYQLWVNMRCEVICTQAYTSCKLRLLPLIAINKGCLELEIYW
jgi:hypothetical protein